MKRILACLAALAIVLAGCGGIGASKPTTLTIGFVPSQDAAGISTKVKPMEDYLSKKLNMPVKSFVGTNFVAVVEAMPSKQVDVAFLNPLSFVMAQGEGAKVILKTVRKGSATYRAQLTARAEDNIPVCDMAKDAKCKATFDALKGKKIAFVDPSSTSGYLFPASFMKGAGIEVEKGKFFSDVVFAGQHDAAAKNVYNKVVDASWTFEDVRDNLEKEMPDVKKKLVQVAFTEPIPNDTVSVRKGLPEDFVKQIKDALVEFSKTEEGKKVLKDLYTIDGFVDGNDKDYDVVKNMAKNMGVDIKAELTKKK